MSFNKAVFFIFSLLQSTLTLAKQYRHQVAKLMSWYLDKVQGNNVLQGVYAL